MAVSKLRADAFVPRFFSFLGGYLLGRVATIGMVAYFTGSTDIAQSIGVPVVCEAEDPRYCTALLTAVDLTLK